MKRLTQLFLLLLVFTAQQAQSAAAPDAKNHPKQASQQYQPKSPKVSRAQLDALLAQPDEVLVIDLRRPDEVSKVGGFPVYLNIQADQLEKNLAYIPKDRTIVTVSNHASRSGKAADFLTSKGFKVLGYVGAKYYEEEGGTLVKIVPPPPKTKAQSKS